MTDREALVELTVNGKRVGMNAYVRSVFLKVVLSLVETLKNTGDPEEIVLKISR